jgi:hypothetical protein
LVFKMLYYKFISYTTEISEMVISIHAKPKTERVKAVLVTVRDTHEHSFKATVLRAGGEESSNLVLIIEKQFGLDWNSDHTTSRVLYRGARLPFGARSTIDNLRQTSAGFVFESRDTGAAIYKVLTCTYFLPEPPAMEELEVQDLACE